MLKKLKRKITLINLGFVSVVFLAALTLFCVQQVTSFDEILYHDLRQAIQFALEPEQPAVTIGSPRPEDVPPRAIPATACVVLRYSPQDGIEILEENKVNIAEETLTAAVSHVLELNKPSGKLPYHRLAFYHQRNDDISYIALGSLNESFLNLWFAMLTGVGLFLGSVLVFYFISRKLSSEAVKPVDAAWEQQKRFIADASHELKTPLTVIMANLNIIAAHPQETVQQQSQWLNSTAEEAGRLKTIIDQMLLLAKNDASSVTYHFRRINCSEAVEEQLLYLEPVAYEHQISLDAHITPELFLETDPEMLQHLIALLVENAIKYSAPNSLVTVRLSDERGILLSVHNEGTPIAEEDLPHIFERFYRSDKARSSEGTGLGLAIAHSITENLHGRIWVESSETSGTTFYVEFRRAPKA